MSSVVVVGSANVDFVVRCEALPVPGQTVLGGDLATLPGGKGANQATAAARAGARTALVAALGNDGNAGVLRAHLEDAGVDTSCVRALPGSSGAALIAVGAGGDNLIVVAPGANGRLTGLTAEDLATIGAADVLLGQLEVPIETVTAAARAAKAAERTVVLNPSPVRPLPAELTEHVDVLIVNAGEAAELGGGEAEAATGVLLDTVPAVAITLGPEGVCYADRSGRRLTVPAPRVTAVDTTAAGDTFAGAFAAALADGRPVEFALRWACAAASLCVERRGAGGSIPDRRQITDRYTTAYGAA